MLRLCSVIIIAMLLMGCGNADPEKYLEHKYKDEIEILNIEEKNIGQNFARYIKVGNALSGEYVDKFSFTVHEDGVITDNYSKLMFENEANKEVHELLNSSGIQYSDISIKFLESDKSLKSLSDCKKNKCLLITGNLTKLEEDVNVYDLLEDLKINGYCFRITVTIDGVTNIIIHDMYNELESETDFLKLFS